jgi:DNA-binding transcriptional LysR family regulator
MDLRGLQIFIEVAEQRSFTRAGERLGYSQPTISFQIRQLEQELGVPLFDRIGHTVSLTDAGRDALQYAQQICNLSEQMSMDARQERQTMGEIRIGMADSLCEPLVAKGFEQFHQAHPRVALKIYNADTTGLIRMMDHNEVDLVCAMDLPVYNSAYITANEEPVGVHFVVSSEHPLAGEARIPVQQLLDYPFLLTEKGMSYRRVMDEMLAQRGLEVQPVLETGRADVLCRLAQEGAGICLLPDYVTERSVARGKLKRLKVVDFEIEVWKQILYRREKWLSPQMRAVIDHLSAMSLI